MKPAEFDSHAAHYDGGLDNPIKRLMGSSADQFIAVKARWLLRREPGSAAGGMALLDYGCGAGDLLRVLAGSAGARRFTGCDVSTGMLAEVGKRWPAAFGPAPNWPSRTARARPSPTGSSTSSRSAPCCTTCRRPSARPFIANSAGC